jgi:gamma-glutamylcyclotransferase
MIYYFAYGLNTNLDQMSIRCPEAKLLGPAKLKNHRLRFAFYADIVSDTSTSVDGVLWIVNKNCLDILDRFEGYPNFYNRKTVSVDYQGQKHKAEVYFMCSGNRDQLPGNTYYSLVVKGYQENHVPVDQIEKSLKMLQKNNNTELTFLSV